MATQWNLDTLTTLYHSSFMELLYQAQTRTNAIFLDLMFNSVSY